MSGASHAPLLKVENLHKAFHSAAGTVQVLNGLHLELHEGEFLAIVGASGSGKSTLLQVLGTLDPADAGAAWLAGESLFVMSPKQMATLRNRCIGFVYQAHHLIPEFDAMENVMLPLLVRGLSEDQAADAATTMLERLGLGHRLHYRPGRLSGGEAQRVAVARAMVGKPRLLLADEPTGNLDEHTAGEVFAAMRDLCRAEGAAVIMVTHSHALAEASDRILCLHAGILHEYASEKL